MVVTTVRVAERLVKAAARFLKPHELTVAQFNLLAVLSTAPGGLAQARMDRLGKTTEPITRLRS